MAVERGPLKVESNTGETDLRAMVEAYRRAFDNRDVAACTGFYAEDATIRFLFGTYQGRAAIEDWHKDRFAAEVQLVRLEDVAVQGNTVVVQAVVTSRRLRLFRIEQAKGMMTLRVEQGSFKEAVLSPRSGAPSHLDWQFR